MKRNIIDILIEQAIPKGEVVQPKFNPDTVAILPGKYVGTRGYVYAWNEATKSYWSKPKKENAYWWTDEVHQPGYKSLSVKLRAAYDEYEKDLKDAIAKAEKKLNAKDTSEEEKTEEKKKWHLFKRAKEKIETETSKLASKLSGNTIYKTDMYYFYKLENGVYSYQDANNTIDAAKWNADAKVLTPEITSYINGLPDRTETEMVTMYNGKNKIKDATGAEIKPLADPSDPNKLAGTNYIKLDGIYYSIPFTSNRGILKTTPLASIIYEPGKGLSAYKEKIDAIDDLPVGQYVYNKSTVTTTKPPDDVVNNNKAVTVSKGKYDYKRDQGKYYTKVKGAKKWIDIDSTKLPDAKKSEAKANIDKMITDAAPEEKENSENTASKNLKTILTSIKNTVSIGEQFSNSALKVYTEWQAESKDKTGTELDEINNKYYSRIDGGYSSKFKPLLDKESNAVKALQSTANESMTQHIGYVLHNIETIQQQKKGWLNIYNDQPAPELDGKAELYKIQDGTTDIIAKGAYGAQINQ